MDQAFFTIGHSNRTLAEFIALLEQAGVRQVVDIRHFPRSRSNPQFNIDTLPAALAGMRIGYQHSEALGGRRDKTPAIAEDVNAFWNNRSFHNYADYALSEPFRAGLDALIRQGDAQPTTVMCSEAVWWRCHRRIVSDYLLASGKDVQHIMGPGRLEQATLSAGARPLSDGAIVYPASAVS